MNTNGLKAFSKHNLNKLTAPAVNQKTFLLEELKVLEDNIKKMSSSGSYQKVDVHNAITKLNDTAIETKIADRETYLVKSKSKQNKIKIPVIIALPIIYCVMFYILYVAIKLTGL